MDFHRRFIVFQSILVDFRRFFRPLHGRVLRLHGEPSDEPGRQAALPGAGALGFAGGDEGSGQRPGHRRHVTSLNMS